MRIYRAPTRGYRHASPAVTKRVGIDFDAFHESRGIDLSADGTMLMVGRPNAAFAGQAEVGTVRVYERVSDPVEDCTLGGDASNVPAYTPCHFPFVYTQPYTYEVAQAGADIDGEAAGDGSGHSVALNADGTILAIGAPSNDGAGGSNAGHVRVYEWSSGAWTFNLGP